MLSGLLIILGGAIYVLFRPGEYLFYRWAGSIGLDPFINAIRDHASSINLHLPDWFIYSLPDGLWAFAFALIIATIWSASRSRLKYFWFAIVPLLVLGLELLQLAGNVPGVFCLQDMLFETTGMAAGFYFGLKPLKNIHHEKVDR